MDNCKIFKKKKDDKCVLDVESIVGVGMIILAASVFIFPLYLLPKR
jgi:hypothetical protein